MVKLWAKRRRLTNTLKGGLSSRSSAKEPGLGALGTWNDRLLTVHPLAKDRWTLKLRFRTTMTRALECEGVVKES